MRPHCSILFALALLLSNRPASAGSYETVPPLGTERPALKLRIVRYTGGTNGQMVVDVRNDGWQTHSFNPLGLYFVPAGRPEKAPQRLGAAGPFSTKSGRSWSHRDRLRLPPKRTARLKLQLFCIDSHRASPSAATKFRLASSRLPRQLRKRIESGTRAIMRAHRAPSASGVKRRVQSHVWKSRNRKWIKLQGERKHERKPGMGSGTSRPTPRPQGHLPRPQNRR